MSSEFDYIVVGAGSAGCIAAARLARQASVLLIEAGNPAGRNPETLSADGFKYAFANDRLMWHRMTVPQADCGGRSLYAGTGRGMGGSGGVNGMVYTRGDRCDFERWPRGWQWQDNEAAFEAIEQQMTVQPRWPTAFVKRFIQACEATGLRRKDHLNDGDLSAFVGCNDVNFADADRRSSYRAWLHDDRPAQLLCATDAQVQRLQFDADRRCTGVTYQDRQGTHVATVRHEVILCAGALETPRLLMLSGVGPADHLASLGIDVVQDAPGVGANLQDHPNVCLFYRSRVSVDFDYPQVYAFDQASRADTDPPCDPPDSCFVAYAAHASIKQSMLRMLPVLALPGRLHDVLPLRLVLRGLIHCAFILPPLRWWVAKVFGIVVILGKPTSRGSLRLASADPDTPARIDPAIYATEQDRDTLLAAVQKAKRIADSPAMREAGVRPLSAGGKTEDPSRIWRWVTAATMTTFHFCGSCRMGDDDASPVDTELRVRGLQNVRVADASVFPEIPVSAINAPSMMVGYRAADLILNSLTHHTETP